MLNERERSHLEDTSSRDLKAEYSALKAEMDVTYKAPRRQWIADRMAFIEVLLAERSNP